MKNYETTDYYGLLFPESTRAIIMIHGRGSNGADMVNSFEGEIAIDNFYIAALNAPEQTWYPKSFLAPKRQNEPMLSNSLKLIQETVEELTDTGYLAENIYILGFSQGACLALEFAAQHAQQFGGIFALSGGLIGDELDSSLYKGDFKNTPVFLGCSDIDSHIPLSRVKESTRILTSLGASVTEKIYPGMPHTVNADELEEISKILNLKN